MKDLSRHDYVLDEAAFILSKSKTRHPLLARLAIWLLRQEAATMRRELARIEERRARQRGTLRGGGVISEGPRMTKYCWEGRHDACVPWFGCDCGHHRGRSSL